MALITAVVASTSSTIGDHITGAYAQVSWEEERAALVADGHNCALRLEKEYEMRLQVRSRDHGVVCLSVTPSSAIIPSSTYCCRILMHSGFAVWSKNRQQPLQRRTVSGESWMHRSRPSLGA